MTTANLKAKLLGGISDISNPLLFHYILNTTYSPYLKYWGGTLNGSSVSISFSDYGTTVWSPIGSYLTEPEVNKLIPYITKKYAQEELNHIMRKCQTKSKSVSIL